MYPSRAPTKFFEGSETRFRFIALTPFDETNCSNRDPVLRLCNALVPFNYGRVQSVRRLLANIGFATARLHIV